MTAKKTVLAIGSPSVPIAIGTPDGGDSRGRLWIYVSRIQHQHRRKIFTVSVNIRGWGNEYAYTGCCYGLALLIPNTSIAKRIISYTQSDCRGLACADFFAGVPASRDEPTSKIFR